MLRQRLRFCCFLSLVHATDSRWCDEVMMTKRSHTHRRSEGEHKTEQNRIRQNLFNSNEWSRHSRCLCMCVCVCRVFFRQSTCCCKSWENRLRVVAPNTKWHMKQLDNSSNVPFACTLFHRLLVNLFIFTSSSYFLSSPFPLFTLSLSGLLLRSCGLFSVRTIN